MNDPGHPNRKDPRLPFKAKVKVRCDSWDRMVSLYTQNISRGGMFLKTESPPAIGTELTINLILPDGRTLDLAAQVAHVVSPERARQDKKSPGMGIFFRPLTPEQQQLVESILDETRKSGPIVDPEAPPDEEPAPPKPDALDDEALKLLAALEAELGRLRELRPWEVLGIAPDADSDQVASAYRVLCKRYHPDVFAQWHAQEVRDAASDCFIVIKKAYERLVALRKVARPKTITPQARPAAAGPAVKPPQAPVIVAEPQPVAGRSRKPSRQFAVPQSFQPQPKSVAPRVATPAPVTRAAEEPEEFKPTPTQLTAKDLFDDISQPLPVQQAPSVDVAARKAASERPAAEEGVDLFRQQRYGEARTRLAEALRRDPRNRVLRTTYHLAVGFDLRGQGREDDARKQFESVLVLDPENADAINALRAQSVEKREQKRGFLDKLLKRE